MTKRQPPSVLYVDDEEMNLTLFKITFRGKFDIHVANGGAAGLSVLKDKGDEVSTIVSDMRMPGMDGIDFITQAKAQYPHLRCFILTGYPANEKVSSAIEKQLIINSFSKPFNVDTIQEAVMGSADE